MTRLLLDLQQVSLKIPGVEQPLLSDINYQIFADDFIVILGSNGSGKSSLLKLIDQRYHCKIGKIYFKGKPIEKYSHQTITSNIITLTQNFHESLFTTLTVFENYFLVKHKNKFFSQSQKIERQACVDYLKKFNANFTFKLDTLVDKLSGGEKQALALALAVIYPPEILLLDEHTSALDPNTAKQLMQLTEELIAKYKMTCVMTTHNLEIALNHGNRILALRDGKIYQAIDAEEKKTLDQNTLLAVCY